MSKFNPRVFVEIIGDMIAKVVSSTPLNDVNYGSVTTTMLEAAATEDDEQYFQMLEIIRGYSLDTTTGADLDLRGEESVGARLAATRASSFISIFDSSVTKVSTETYSGFQGAVKDQEFIYGDSAEGFKAAGAIVIGRGTPNSERITYSSIDIFTNYVKFNISPLAKDHGTDETIIMAQGGNRLIVSGTVVYVPESDTSERIEYTLDEDATILDGERELTDVAVSASSAGAEANVPIGAIRSFDSKPFPTANVKNIYKITNGTNEETDQEYRDRIKDHIQSLSKGNRKSIITGINNLVSTSDNKRVVSSSMVEPTIPADVVKIYIDDGAGSVFSYKHIGVETIVSLATGGEKFVNIVNVPMVKAFAETQMDGPWDLLGGEELYVDVGGEVETIIFESTDFVKPGQAKPQEVLTKINNTAKSFESRISGEGIKVFARANSNEEIRVTGGSANDALLFPIVMKYTSRIYLVRDKKVRILSKDGRTASIEAGRTQSYDLGLGISHIAMVIDGKVENVQCVMFKPVNDFVNPLAATTLEIIEVMNEQLSGAIALESSNGNKFKLTSNIERSSGSKVRVLENFTSIFIEETGVLVDRLVELKDEGTNNTVFNDDFDYCYVGHDSIKFPSITVRLNTPASANIDYGFEYYDGSDWVEMGVHDQTLGFTESGIISFQPPCDWERTMVEGVMGYFVRMQRNQDLPITPPSVNVIRVCLANEAFGFSEVEVIGADSDYLLNRFLGQIELNEPLEAYDKLTIGSFDTRSILVSGVSGNYSGLVGQALEITIDGVVVSYTFQSSDFFDDDSAFASEVVTALNREFQGITASSVDGLIIDILLNRYEDEATLKVSDGGANSIFQFSTEEQVNLEPHVASLECNNIGPFSLSEVDNLIVVIDNNFSNAFDIKMGFTSTLTGYVDSTHLVDSAMVTTFENINEVVGYKIKILDGPEIGQIRNIVSYSEITGTMELDAALSDPTLVEYAIIPSSTSTVVSYLNNNKITLLSNRAEIKQIDGKFQFSSLVAGEEGSVQVSGGTANDVFDFPVNVNEGVDGYRHYIGLPQLVQWTVDGKDDGSYEGIRAAGVQVEVAEPVTKFIFIQLDVTPQEGTTLSAVTNSIKSAVSGYVNQLGVGEDVIVSDITVQVKQVTGVFDVSVVSPEGNLAMADNEMARINEADISVG